MDYTAERKNKADDRMTTATRRFKKYKAKSAGDYGDVPAEYAKAATGATYEETTMNDTTQDLLLSVLAEAVAFNEARELKSTDPKMNCAVCGGVHHPAAKHTARALAPENDNQAKMHKAKLTESWDDEDDDPGRRKEYARDHPIMNEPETAQDRADHSFSHHNVLSAHGYSHEGDGIYKNHKTNKKFNLNRFSGPSSKLNAHLSAVTEEALVENLVGPRLVKNGFTKHAVEGGQMYKHPEHGEIHIPNSNGMDPTVIHKRPNGSQSHVGYLNMHPYMNKMGLKEAVADDDSQPYNKIPGGASLGKVKATHVPSGKSHVSDITNSHLQSIAHQDRFHDLPKKFGGNVQSKYPKPQDYVDHLNRLAAAQKGNGGHEWHHELQEASRPTPAQMQKASIFKKVDGKEVLDELGEADEDASYKSIARNKKKKLKTESVSLWEKLTEAKKKKNNFKSNRMTISTTPEDIRRKAMQTVGTPPAKKVIKSKLEKKPKYKENFYEDVDPQIHKTLTKHGYNHTESLDKNWERYEHPDSSHVNVHNKRGDWEHKGPDKSKRAKQGDSVNVLDHHLGGMK